MTLALFAIACYLISAIGLLMSFFNKLKANPLTITTIGLIGLLLHIAYIFVYYQVNDEHAYSLLLATNVMVTTVTLISVGFALLSRNYFTLPVNLLFSSVILFTSLFIPIEKTSFATWSLQTLSHISLALVSYAILLIGTLLSLQYSFIAYRLKHHDLSVLRLPMPPLDAIEKQIMGLIKIGTLVLSLSIITGFFFLDNFIGSGQAHKAILSIVAWFCFIAVLIGHQRLGWRGKQILMLSTSGSILLTVGYFGSRLIKEFILR